MGRLFDGVNDSLQTASTVDLSGSGILTVAFWLYWDSFADDDDLALEFGSGNQVGGFIIDPNSGSGVFEWWLVGNVGFSNAYMTRPSAAAWHHYTLLLDKTLSTNEASVGMYLDGVSQTVTQTGVNSNNTDAFGNLTLNFMCRNNSALFGAGRLAEVALWSGVNLNASEAVALSKGVCPLLVRPTSLVAYYPLVGKTSPEIEVRKGISATVNGAVVTEHPRVLYPTSTIIPRYTAAAAAAAPHRLLLLGAGI